jgi:hypothetical protein
MLYNFKITTPANTLASAKQKTTIKLAYGVIHQIDVQFPPGPSGLLHCHINDAIHQIAPYNTDEDFASDNVNISYREFLPLLFEPYIMTVFTWNLDDTYEHSVIIRIGILPPAVLAPWLLSYEERIKAAMGI